MKKQQNSLPDTHAVLSGERKSIHNSSLSWFMKTSVNIAALLIFSALDFSTVFDLFDHNLSATGWSIAMVAAGICLAENFIATVSARLMHNALLIRSRRKVYITLLVISLVAVVLLLSALGYMRWDTRNAEITNVTDSLDIPDEADTASTEEATDASSKDSLALMFLVVPWVTSSLSFFLSFLTDDPARGHYQRVEMSLINAQEHLAELKATLTEASADDPSKREELILHEYASSRETAYHWVREWLSQWELMLIAHMGTVESAEVLAELYDQIELVSGTSAPVQLYSNPIQKNDASSAA